ncbi:NUDIX domain-containing protein [Candidatus Saccharibacteria bacterium]|nr:NUDIX domain-containing protein [Candidatus Saccharibacteria bacterium]
MPYVGSYVWKIRQKIGHDFLVMPSVDTVIERDDGKVLMIYNKSFDGWAFPGGSVEPHQTWREAALAETQEESGINAHPDDLILFATVSGPGYVFHYQNGDQTQVYTNCFALKNWQSESDISDKDEISQKKWFSLDEAKQLPLTLSSREILPAYEKWLETGQIQMIEARK